MQRNFLRGLLICLIPCLLAGIVAVQPDKYRLGIDLAGGTILVYQVNLERTALREEADQQLQGGSEEETYDKSKGLDRADLLKLASEIKRRIDPTDIKNVTVRPLGNNRIEIILPTAGGASSGRQDLTADDIEETKALMRQMGVMEFRILANGPDDAEGIRAARTAIEQATDLQQRAELGLPPRGPDGTFPVNINDEAADVRYAWAELGPQQRASLGLSNANEGDAGLWTDLARARGKQVVFVGTGGQSATDVESATIVLFSRVVTDKEQLAEEANRKAKLEAPDDPSDREQQELQDERDRVKARYKELRAAENDPKNRQQQELIRQVDAETNRIITEQGLNEEEARELAFDKLAFDAVVNEKKYEYFALTRVSDKDSVRIEGDVGLNAAVGTDETGDPAIDFTFTGSGPQKFGLITRRNKPSNNVSRQLAILIDGEIVSAPSIRSEITARGQITGDFTRKEVEEQVKILRSGALSAELMSEPVSQNTIGPTLGQDTVEKGLWAIGLAFLAVLAFMLFYYRFAGLVACIALFANLLLTVGFMVGAHAAFTLPGLAGLVLTLGIAVDANVLIYERLREERNKGANLATSIRNGYDRAFTTIIDTHLTSIFTAVVLYTFGNDQLKGFAIALTAGLVISLFMSLYMTRLMFDYWLHRRWLTNLKMMRLFGKLNFHPMKYRYYLFTLTAGLTIAGFLLFINRGEAGLNVDFRGGTVYGGRLKEGEERALTTTPDGKRGFRDLLTDEDWLNQRLKVLTGQTTWVNRPSNRLGEEELSAQEILSLNRWVYRIAYDNGEGKAPTELTVSLTQPPAGAGLGGTAAEDAMKADVVKRAGQLPDVSVEQTYKLGESDFGDGKSRLFTVRTTEKQPEFVRVALARLLVDDEGKPLMPITTMEEPVIEGAKATLTFSEPISVARVKELINLAFLANSSGDVDNAGSIFALKGVGEEEEGKFRTMELTGVARIPGYEKVAEDPAKLESVLTIAKQSLESSPEPLRLEVFDSQLAGETRNKAFFAILASWVAILLFLWFRFGNWTFGLAAVLCLVHDICFTLGAVAVCNYLFTIPIFNTIGIEDFKIDLTAVAALLTLVGYSVSDTIVVFDRIREVRGKNPKLTPEMIDESVNLTLARTILTSTTVFLVSAVLFFFGGEGVHLFAFVMVIGVLVGTYSSVFVAAKQLTLRGSHHAFPLRTCGARGRARHRVRRNPSVQSTGNRLGAEDRLRVPHRRCGWRQEARHRRG